MATLATIGKLDKKSVCERIILSMLAKMDRGTLFLTLPDGATIRMGSGEEYLVANIHVKDNYFFKRCLLYGDIGFGEAYVAGEWDTDNITNVIKWFLLNVNNAPSVSGSNVKTGIVNVLRLFNRLSHTRKMNSVNGSRKNIAAHYDLNNEFFSLFLDPTMTYSSAYFIEDGMNLEAAQYAKYDRLCRQLQLKATDRVLEIGTGWGGNAVYMAKRYGCHVTTITISQEQYKLAKERVAEEKLEHRVEVLLQDYRLAEGKYDKIVSIEMLEAVGAGFMDRYFSKCYELLKPQGILALQVITCPDSRFDTLKKSVDWIQKHIFPGSLLPSVAAINRSVNKTGDMTLVDLKDIGLHYATTLEMWRKQFNKNLPGVKKLGFDDAFIRKWNYYLCYCEAAFAMRNIHVMQMTYTRPNNTLR